MIYINGNDLTIEQVIAVSRQGETVAIAPDARERINAARAYVDRKLADKAVVYGLTTGFGKFSTVFVPEEETAQLQRNLIISHACGMGGASGHPGGAGGYAAAAERPGPGQFRHPPVHHGDAFADAEPGGSIRSSRRRGPWGPAATWRPCPTWCW